MSKISGQLLISGQFQDNWEPCIGGEYVINYVMQKSFLSKVLQKSSKIYQQMAKLCHKN